MDLDAAAAAAVGWREWVALPDLGVEAVKAKVDTGAKTSALHAWEVEVSQGRVSFVLHPEQDDETTTLATAAELIDHREIRSSNGVIELRPVIRTRLAVGAILASIELTLTARDEMGFRMLLGREALRSLGVVVDPAKSFLHGGTRLSPP